MDNEDEDLEQALANIPWSALIIPMAIGVAVAVLFIVLVAADAV